MEKDIPLKDMFNYESIREVVLSIKSNYIPFQTEEFLKSVFDNSWDDLGLMERARKITINLGKYLPNYREAVIILEKSLRSFPIAFFFPDFIEVFGQEESDWDFSISSLERNTEYWSSELAIRQFIIKNEERTMAKMYEWSKHKNEHIRRLASEGCRPALPWAIALISFKKDPTPILPILEELKNDLSLYVRRSVANNLNDISKTHADLVGKLAREWYGKNKKTDWVIKHACRTLLKKGNRDLLSIFGYNDDTSIEVEDFTLNSTFIRIRENIVFSFKVLTKKPTKVRFEYGIDYVKSNGKRN